jgi:hypothetical protein
MGFRLAALRNLNGIGGRITGVSARLEADVGRAFAERKGTLHEFVRGGAMIRNLLKHE